METERAMFLLNGPPHDPEFDPYCVICQKMYKIIIGLGSALRYLHQEWEQCVVHGDIKPSNIILDSSYNTKPGDFGLARLVDHGAKSRTKPKSCSGPPGTSTRSSPSTESDVYSFGVVLLEIVSGRRPVEEPDDSDELFVLSRWVWDLYSKNAVVEAVDERLGCSDDGDGELQMERVLAVGLWCAHPDRSEHRPWRRLCTPCSRRRQGCRLFGRRCTRVCHFLPWESMGSAISQLAPPAPMLALLLPVALFFQSQ
uniref:Protein kinase domain-containing protein n=1 Tax=Oryza meridionalis TaxID=40149 RepID=A0A0E0EQX2_9ORYZ